jgi:hypothetical protein
MLVAPSFCCISIRSKKKNYRCNRTQIPGIGWFFTPDTYLELRTQIPRLLNTYLLVANIMTESSHGVRNATELTQAADLCIMFAQYFGQILIIYNISTPTVRWMRKSVGHSHGSLALLYIHDCRWWSETLWETLIRLRLQGFVMLPWTIELLLWRFLCNFIDMILCRVSDLGWLGVWSLECEWMSWLSLTVASDNATESKIQMFPY